MLFPGTRRRTLRVPHVLVPLGLAVCAVFSALAAWVLFAPSNTGAPPASLPVPDITAIRSVAYVLPGPEFDDIVVEPADQGSAPRVIASFPNSGLTGYHARGAASTHGDEVAVLWLPSFATHANLSVVSVASGDSRQVEGKFDYLSTIAWAPDGRSLALTSTSPLAPEATKVFEVDIATLQARPVAEFANAFDAAPVGYSFDSQRLFIVIVDQRGSVLHAVRAGKVQSVAELSPGRTRDWSLSPDGARLAFVDILGAGSRTYVGRTLVIATGAVTTLPAEKNQVGATWMPGSPIPAFGGPGGSWLLAEPAPESAYLVPVAWSPHGAYLVGAINIAGADKPGRQPASLELIAREAPGVPSSGRLLSSEPGASFLGWVRNLN